MTALFVRSLTNSRVMDLGFDANGVITGRITLDRRHYDDERGARFYEDLLQRLEASPALKSVNIAEFDGPLGPGAAKLRAVGLEQTSSYSVFAVSRGHFRTLGIPLIAGRDFDVLDARSRQKVGVVNSALAQQHWPGETPIGKYLDGVEIIGVVQGTNYLSNSNTPKQFLYVPLAQNHTPDVLLIAKANGDPSHVTSLLAEAVARQDPDVPLADASSLNSLAELSLRPVRIVAAIAGILGTLALALAAIGIYGTVAFLARQRTREIGIRIALGAPRSRVAKLITREALRWTAVGLVVGFTLTIPLAHAVKGLIFGIAATDLPSFLTVTLLLGTVAFTASWLPARRASRIDPIVALRHE
jgi:predicted permease